VIARIVVGLAVMLVVWRPGEAVAQLNPPGHDAQLWTEVVLTVNLSPTWQVFVEGQPRWSDDWSTLQQVIARGALGYRLNPRWTIWGGYAWIPRTRGPGTQYEQRIFQQLSGTFPTIAKWTPLLRVRLEQRFLDTWADNSHRLRVRGRVVRPIDEKGLWSIALSDEAMVTFDDTARGPWQGVDQNRAYGGLLRRLSPNATIEGGYLWQTTKPPTSTRTHSHAAVVIVNFTM
jgi:hypothetical protein